MACSDNSRHCCSCCSCDDRYQDISSGGGFSVFLTVFFITLFVIGVGQLQANQGGGLQPSNQIDRSINRPLGRSFIQ